jgi:hypothetical protein
MSENTDNSVTIDGKNGGKLKPFQPGQSGNPGGISKEMRAKIARNAEMATLIRERMLSAELAKMDADPNYTPELEANLRSFIKDTEDRGFGAPKNSTEIAGPDGGPVSVTALAVNFVRPEPTDG